MSKKIVFFAPLPPPLHGSSYMTALVVQSKLGGNVSMYCINTHYNEDVQGLGKLELGKVLKFSKYLFRLIADQWRGRWDIAVVVPSFKKFNAVRDGIVICMVRMLTNGKVALWVHSNDFTILWKDSGMITRALIRFSHSLTACHILVGQALRKQFEGHLDLKRIKVLHNGIPDYPFEREKNGTEEMRFIFLSNMIKQKGWMTLGIVADDVCDLYANVRFDFYGAPSSDSPIEEIKLRFSQYRNESKIQYHGPVYSDEKADILAASDVFILPTSYPTEALPMSIIEAMQNELAVISTNIGAIAEIIIDGKGGRVVSADDDQALKDAIINLIKNPELIKEMGKFNREKYLKELTLNAHMNKWQSICEDIY